MDIKIKKI